MAAAIKSKNDLNLDKLIEPATEINKSQNYHMIHRSRSGNRILQDVHLIRHINYVYYQHMMRVRPQRIVGHYYAKKACIMHV